MEHVTVGVNDFVRRQIKGTGKTYSSLTYSDIAKYAEDEMNKNNFKEGYRDGVILIPVDKKYIRNFQNIYSKGDLIPHEKINQLRLTHIHIWEHGTDDWNRHIAFRDYLREYPEIKSQYESLKKQLSIKDWKDGNEYNDAKDSFIKTEEAKAILWVGKINQPLFP